MSKSYEKYFTEKGLSNLTGKQHRELSELESNVGFFGLITFVLMVVFISFLLSLMFWFNNITLYVTCLLLIMSGFTGTVSYMYYKDYVKYLKIIFETMKKDR